MKKLFRELVRPMYKVFVRISAAIINLFHPSRFTTQVAGQINSVDHMSVNGKTLAFVTSSWTPLWRAETLLEKEPETLEWLSEMESEDVFWDIGANVGLYSIFAAVVCGTRVVAFEPHSLNFSLLQQNIEINQLGDLISALCIGIGYPLSIGVLNIPDFRPGTAYSQLNSPIKDAIRPFQQATLCMTLDELLGIPGMPSPTRVKIDVDGLESVIFLGHDNARGVSDNFLTLPKLQSIQVELEAGSKEETDVASVLENSGFRLRWRRHGDFYETGEYSMIYNYVFDRVR